MSALTLLSNSFSIDIEIQNHPAWLGKISGLKAEKMLRAYKTPYLYILRAGEHETDDSTDYYVTFVQADGTVKHQPFTTTITFEGWYYENGGPGGPFHAHISINSVLHQIMHCNEGECKPLTIFDKA